MRSPWQFISDLANRRRQRLAEQNSDPTAGDGPDRLFLPAPSELPQDIAAKGDAESRPGQSARQLAETLRDETPLRTKVSPAEPVGDSPENDRETLTAPEISSDSQPEIVPKTKAGAARPARAAKPASQYKPDLAPASDSTREQVAVERTFHDDVRSVDDDIKRLRTELADKLRLQNEQLKKMLERFDRP